ncbi:MAG: RNA-binding protein [Acidobacteriota bacterium]|nr:RNA-binding protein [Acidobacteriota bacterium]
MGRRLYVGNLPYSATEDQLTDLFSRAGQVDNVRVMRDMATGRARGFAFVEMGSDDDAQKAVSQLNDYQMDGRPLVVNEARPKTEADTGAAQTGAAAGGKVVAAATSSARIFQAAGEKNPAGDDGQGRISPPLRCYSSTIQPSRRLMTRLP